jgi:hypothetical protein
VADKDHGPRCCIAGCSFQAEVLQELIRKLGNTRCALVELHSRIVGICHDACSWNGLRDGIPKPIKLRSRVGPCLPEVSVETVYGNNAYASWYVRGRIHENMQAIACLRTEVKGTRA